MAANVLTFDASRRRVLRQGVTAVAGKVLLFSGVRYERVIADQSTTAGPTASPDQTATNGQDAPGPTYS